VKTVEIFIISRSSSRAEAFAGFASRQGHTVRMISGQSEALGDILKSGTVAVVVFDDGGPGLTEGISRLRRETRYLSTPIVIVKEIKPKESSTRLMAAGASYVLAPSCTDEQLMAEITARCDIQPVVEELREALLKPFSEAAMMAMKEMAGMQITINTVYQKNGYRMFGDISAVIGLIAKTEGSLVISFPSETAKAVVGRILASVQCESNDDVIRDCVGEIANVIAGQARGVMIDTPYRFGMSTPTIVAGAHHEICHKAGMPCLVVVFGSDVGDFAMQLCMAI
jgi:chemotaxis protein CheX